LQDRPVSGDIPVKVLGGRNALHQLAAKRRLAYLPWASEQDHLTLQISRDKIVEIAFHADSFNAYCKQVATFLQ
jgi:hypothetical protein